MRPSIVEQEQQHQQQQKFPDSPYFFSSPTKLISAEKLWLLKQLLFFWKGTFSRKIRNQQKIIISVIILLCVCVTYGQQISYEAVIVLKGAAASCDHKDNDSCTGWRKPSSRELWHRNLSNGEKKSIGAAVPCLLVYTTYEQQFWRMAELL